MDNKNITIKKYKKLRDAIHDIVTNLDDNEWISIDELSKKLNQFNIRISRDALNKILLNWKKNNDYIVFEPKDIDWLYFDEKDEYVFNTLNFYKPPSLGKSKEKIKKEEIKELKKKREKEKEKIIENIEKIESKDPILCPISTQVILNSFKDLDEIDVLKIKRFIEKAINENYFKNIYEEAWEYMVNEIPKEYPNGLGYNLSDNYINYKLSKNMVIPSFKDLDIYVRLWHYKYGYGSIDYIFNDHMTIDFDNITIVKRIKMDISIKNNSIRVDKSYIKKPIPLDNDKYEYAYLSELEKGDEVYHIKRGKGTVFENFKYHKDIKFVFENIKIKMTKKQFLKEQNIFKPKKEKKGIIKNFSLFKDRNDTKQNNPDTKTGTDVKNIEDDWVRIKYENEIKEGMLVKFQNILYRVNKIFNDSAELKSVFNNTTSIWKKNKYIRAGLYRKVEWVKADITDLKKGMIIKLAYEFQKQWIVNEIDYNSQYTYIRLNDGKGSSRFMPLNSLKNKVYIKK